MPRFERPPEAADGGFWFVVPAITVADEDDGAVVERPALPDHATEWCAWYADVDGARVCAVRLPAVTHGIDTLDIPVAAVIAGWGQKPRGRIRGR